MVKRLSGLASFAVIAAVLFVSLRVAHLAIPLFYPEVLSGPFSLDDPANVEQYAGFSPLLPFYRPEVLGERTVNITVHRKPLQKAIFFWQAERFLYLEEALDGELPEMPLDAVPLLAGTQAAVWRRGKTVHVAALIDGLSIQLRTDLSQDDARRIVESLRPYEEIR